MENFPVTFMTSERVCIIQSRPFIKSCIKYNQQSANTLRYTVLLLVNFAFEYAHRRVQVNQDGLKLNGTHQLVVYAYDVNILGGSVHTTKKKTEALVVDSKEVGLEANADKTKCMAISRDQNAGRSHNMKTDNSSFEMMEEFKYLGTNLTNQNSIQEEIKSRVKSGNA